MQMIGNTARKLAIKHEFVMLDTLGLSAGTGSDYVHLCGWSTVGTYEGPVAQHRL